MESKEKKKKKILKGVVVSNKMSKAVVVKVYRKFPHPKYEKIVSTSKKYYARSEKEYSVGSEVTIEECRPLSKLIRWKVIK